MTSQTNNIANRRDAAFHRWEDDVAAAFGAQYNHQLRQPFRSHFARHDISSTSSGGTSDGRAPPAANLSSNSSDPSNATTHHVEKTSQPFPDDGGKQQHAVSPSLLLSRTRNAATLHSLNHSHFLSFQEPSAIHGDAQNSRLTALREHQSTWNPWPSDVFDADAFQANRKASPASRSRRVSLPTAVDMTVDPNEDVLTADPNADAWLPPCFLSQMLGALDPHHSVSHPHTPINKSSSRFSHDESADARRLASRLVTLQRSRNSEERRSDRHVTDKLRLDVFDSVETRATICAQELHEMIAHVKSLNTAADALRRQLAHSKAVSARMQQQGS